jgi:hypothetical protein
MKHELDFKQVVEEMSPITTDELRRYSSDSKRTLQAKKDREAEKARKKDAARSTNPISVMLITGLIASTALYV